jgi:hypothetical protein
MSYEDELIQRDQNTPQICEMCAERHHDFCEKEYCACWCRNPADIEEDV